MALFADRDGRLVRAEPDTAATCRGCGAPMVPKCGGIIIWHWAHARGAECDPWTESESEWHLGWKELFLDAGCEIEQTMRRGGEWHRADVVLPDATVVELQHGYLNPDAIRARSVFYGDMVWIYDAERFISRITPQEWRDELLDFTWPSPARSLLAHHYTTDAVYWDAADIDLPELYYWQRVGIHRVAALNLRRRGDYESAPDAEFTNYIVHGTIDTDDSYDIRGEIVEALVTRRTPKRNTIPAAQLIDMDTATQAAVDRILETFPGAEVIG